MGCWQEDILHHQQLDQIQSWIQKILTLWVETFSFAAAAYLEQTKFIETGKKVYFIGEVRICDELDLIGVPYLGGQADASKQPDMSSGGWVEHEHDVVAVIVGFDRTVNYYKIQYAQLCINENAECQFIATNLGTCQVCDGIQVGSNKLTFSILIDA